jgi:hypothetical protein
MIYLLFPFIFLLCFKLLVRKYEKKSDRIINKLLTEWIYQSLRGLK